MGAKSRKLLPHRMSLRPIFPQPLPAAWFCLATLLFASCSGAFSSEQSARFVLWENGGHHDGPHDATL